MDKDFKIALSKTNKKNIFSEIKKQLKYSIFEGLALGSILALITKRVGIGLFAYGYILGISMRKVRNEIVNSFFK